MTTVVDRGTASLERPVRASRILDDADGWSLTVPDALEAARSRGTFRLYLESKGHPASDFHAAESAYGELIANCACHAPGPLRVEFRWDDSTLTVIDAHDRLRCWPFSEDDFEAESTHHSYALLCAFTARVHISREHGGGTRVQVTLPVRRA